MTFKEFVDNNEYLDCFEYRIELEWLYNIFGMVQKA